jgi:hypothetical protein
MNVVVLIAGQLIALALGAAVTTALVDRGPGSIAVRMGYGYVLGSIGTTLILRAMSVAGWQWNFVVPASIAAVAAVAIAAGTKWRGPARDSAAAIRNDDGPARGVLFWLLLALVVIHAGLALAEAWLRPLFPWDATTHWATKARVFYELRGLVPFVDDMTWVRTPGSVYTDAHPYYPATIPLFQVWAALAWGSFDDAVVNIGWPLTLVALAAGVYGQLRRLGLAPTAAILGAYAVISLPFVDVHAALAGYADLGLATLYAFAVLALACWARWRRAPDLALVLVCAAALPALKAPGWAWLGTVLVGLASVHLSRRLVLGLAITGTVAVVGFAVLAANLEWTVMGYRFQALSLAAPRALIDNLYAADSWHLLGVAVPLALVFARRTLLSGAYLPVGAALGAGALFLVVVFLFSNTSEEGVTTAVTVNRALLHWVPALLAYAAWAVAGTWRQQFGAAPAGAPPAREPALPRADPAAP